MGTLLPFSNRIRALREEAGLTQAELALRIGLTRQTVNALENGKYSPSLEAAFRISLVLRRPLEEVFVWTAHPDGDTLP